MKYPYSGAPDQRSPLLHPAAETIPVLWRHTFNQSNRAVITAVIWKLLPSSFKGLKLLLLQRHQTNFFYTERTLSKIKMSFLLLQKGVIQRKQFSKLVEWL